MIVANDFCYCELVLWRKNRGRSKASSLGVSRVKKYNSGSTLLKFIFSIYIDKRKNILRRYLCESSRYFSMILLCTRFFREMLQAHLFFYTYILLIIRPIQGHGNEILSSPSSAFEKWMKLFFICSRIWY